MILKNLKILNLNLKKLKKFKWILNFKKVLKKTLKIILIEISGNF